MKYKRIFAVLIAVSLGLTGGMGVLAQDTSSTEVNAGDTVIDYTPYSAKYLGDGMLIAVIGSGFDVTHECFAAETVDAPSRGFDSVEGLNAVHGEGTFYVNEKIPFAYNYADRSTDVIGSHAYGTGAMSVIAGNSMRFKGEAPNARLLAMKVMSDTAGASTDAAVSAAIEDAITLGADVIYLEVCDRYGFDDRTVSGSSLEDVLAKAEAAGIIVVAPAGEMRDLGDESIYYREAGISTSPVEYVDRGSIGYPASSKSALAVASADTNLFICDSLLLAEDKLPYGDSNDLYLTATDGRSFAEYFNGKTLEYEIVPGFGRTEDYPEGFDLTGKLALVERGEITFSEKCLNAYAHGAIGVIVIDNQVDDKSALSVLMDLSESPIPAVIVSISSGKLLKKAADRRVSVSSGDKYAVLTAPTPTPSETSAVGVTPELGLKPELSAVAGSVACASAGGGYSTESGTAIAAARLAGILACAKQRLLDDISTQNSSLSPTELAARVKNLAVSSARLMYKKDGVTPYSPRSQGSGEVSLESVLEAGLIVSANGGTKLELGELSGRYIAFEVEVENLSSEPVTCKLDVVVGSDGYNSFTYSELENEPPEGRAEKTLADLLGKQSTDTVSFVSGFKPFANAKVLAFDGETDLNAFSSDAATEPLATLLTLDAYERAAVKLAILIDEATFEEYGRVFTNGYFVEGFVRVTEVSDGECASLPFVGFMGDFSKQGVLDHDGYSPIFPVYDNTLLYYRHSGDFYSGELMLGLNPYEHITDDTLLSREYSCFSPIASPYATVRLRLALARNVENVRLRLTDAAGRLILERELGGLAKTHVDYATNTLKSPIIDIWDGRAPDNRDYIYPDGWYDMELTFKLPGDERVNSLRYSFKLDTLAPTVEVIGFESDGGALLNLNASDDTALAVVTVVDKHRVTADELEPGVYDISTLEGRYIYIEAVDYALNSTVIRVENPNYSPDADLLPLG